MRALVLLLPLFLSLVPLRAQVERAAEKPVAMAPGVSYDPAIPTLEQVTGHDVGAEISAHRDVEDYLRALQAAAPDRMQLVEYGKSWQGRTLYYAGSFHEPFFRALWWLGPAFLIAAPVYFARLDGVLVDPRDKYWHLGSLVLGRRGDDVDRGKALDLVRAWVIKGFFIPLMYGFLLGALDRGQNMLAAASTPFQWLELVAVTIGTVDVLWAVFGYVLSLRIVDSHVRTTEPTVLGWVAAIGCYEPFFGVVGDQYLNYAEGPDWTTFVPVPIQIPWFLVIIALSAVFSLATVDFGLRFSNLTNRGIVTSGMYRFTKHPAYVSKLFIFALQALPFTPQRGLAGAASATLKWLGIGAIYLIRARTEEAHLSRQDPDYVRYALWMNDHGVFAFLGRWFPVLRYQPPTDWRDPAEGVEGG